MGILSSEFPKTDVVDLMIFPEADMRVFDAFNYI